MPKPSQAIEFIATVFKVQTLVDNGLRVTLDLPEDAIADVAALMECKRLKVPLKVNVKTNTPETTKKPRETIE